MIGSLGDIENKAQELLANEAKRLGIPDGTAWQVTPEGKAITVNTEQEQTNGVIALTNKCLIQIPPMYIGGFLCLLLSNKGRP